MANRTDHSDQIQNLRTRAEKRRVNPRADDSSDRLALAYEMLADLLELHDRTSLSLDNWPSVRAFYTSVFASEIEANGA